MELLLPEVGHDADLGDALVEQLSDELKENCKTSKDDEKPLAVLPQLRVL